MMLSSGRKRRRFLAYATLSALFVGLAACSSSESRDRNVQAVVGTPCKPAGQTKKFAKVTHVCGSTPTGTVWFTSVKSKAKAVNCTKLGAVRLKGKNTQVCGRDGKKKVWVLVAPLPPSMSGVETTAPVTSIDSSIASPESTVPNITSPTTATTTGSVAAFTPGVATSTPPVEATVTKAAIESPATTLRFTKQPKKSANGVAMSPQIVVQVGADDGSPRAVGGVEVTLVSATAGVDVSGNTATTSADGVATFENAALLGPPGKVELVAIAAGFVSANVVVDHAAGVPVRVEFVARPSTMVAGDTWGDSLSARLIDIAGHPVRRAGVGMTLRARTTGMVLRGIEDTVTDADGVAHFMTSKIETAGTAVLDVVVEDDSIQSASFDVEVGAADAARVVVFSSLPDGVDAGVAIADSVEVGVVDRFGNPVKTGGKTIVASVLSTDPERSVSVEPSEVKVGPNGRATFSNLTISGDTGAVNLVFDLQGDTLQAFEMSIDVRHGPAVGLRLAVEPSGARSGLNFAVAPQVEVVDAFGNRLPAVEGDVTLVIDDATTVTASTNLTASFDNAGIAKFANLKIRGKVGTYTVRYVFGAFTLAGTITLDYGLLFRIAFSNVPTNIAAGGQVGGVIQLLDEDDNLYRARGVSIGKYVDDTLQSTWLSGGTGSMPALVVAPSKLGDHILGASVLVGQSKVRTMTISQELVVFSGSPDGVTAVDPVAGTWASGAASTSPLKVQVVDSYVNTVSKGGVALSATVEDPLGRYTVKNGTATTNDAGVAEFKELTISGPAGSISLRVSLDGDDFKWARPLIASVNLVAGAPAGLRLERAAAGLRNGLFATVQPIIQVVDSAGNDVKKAGLDVLAGGIGSKYVVSGVATTDANGQATFSDLKAAGIAAADLEIFYATSGITSTKQTFILEAGMPSAVAMALTNGAVVDSGVSVGPEVVVFDGSKNVVSMGNYSVEVSMSTPPYGAAWLTAPSPLVIANGKLDGSAIRLFGTPMTQGQFVVTLRDSSKEYKLTRQFSFNNGAKAGDPGPSGGWIIASSSVAVPGVSNISDGGRIMELAPVALSRRYAMDVPNVSRSSAETNTGFGEGIKNTAALLALNRPNGVFAAAAAAGAVIGGKSDWFLGSLAEMGGAMEILRTKVYLPNEPTPKVMTSSLSRTVADSTQIFGFDRSYTVNVSTLGYVVPVRLFG